MKSYSNIYSLEYVIDGDHITIKKLLSAEKLAEIDAKRGKPKTTKKAQPKPTGMYTRTLLCLHKSLFNKHLRLF